MEHYVSSDSAAMTRSTPIVLAAFIVLFAITLWLSHDASAQFNAASPQFEYLLLVLDEAKPVALTAGDRVEITPPARLPTGRIEDPGVSNNSYSLRSIEERHVSVGALNLLGDQGWEAVNSVPYANGATAILMKRRVG